MTSCNSGLIVRFAVKLWSGRSLVLRRLAKKRRRLKAAKEVLKMRQQLDKAGSKEQKLKVLRKAAKKLNVS